MAKGTVSSAPAVRPAMNRAKIDTGLDYIERTETALAALLGMATNARRDVRVTPDGMYELLEPLLGRLRHGIETIRAEVNRA